MRTDELTRMFNFRYFNQALSLEVERTRRSGQPTCLIMLGLDHFKAVNDAFSDEGKSGSVPKKLNSERPSPSAS